MDIKEQETENLMETQNELFCEIVKILKNNKEKLNLLLEIERELTLREQLVL